MGVSHYFIGSPTSKKQIAAAASTIAAAACCSQWAAAVPVAATTACETELAYCFFKIGTIWPETMAITTGVAKSFTHLGPALMSLF